MKEAVSPHPPPNTHTQTHTHTHRVTPTATKTRLFPPHLSLPQEQELESSQEGVRVWGAGQGPLAVECGHHGIPEKEQKASCLPSPEQSTRRKSGHSALGFSPQETRALQGLPLPFPTARVQLHVSARLFG